jgi:glycosyltransferase involved in cell wall biosynthesis
VETNKLRICWYSNSPLGVSAYSKITKAVTGFLQKQGYPICVAVNWGHEGAELECEGVKLYPRIGVGMSEKWAVESAKDFNADLMISMYDQWALGSLGQWLREACMPDVQIPMFDHAFISEPLKKRLSEAFEIVSPTKYGETLCRQAGFTNLTMIPFGCDTNIYKPSDLPKPELRASIGFPDCDFVFGIFSMTRLRKGIPYALEAIKMVSEANPDLKAGIYIHGLHTEEYDLIKILDALDLTKMTRFPDEFHYHLGWDELQMAKAMNSVDCIVQAGFGEGFGLPTIEGMAVGVPVIGSNHTAFTELISPVAPELLAPPLGEFWVETVPCKVYLPNVEKLADILDKIMDTDPTEYRDKLRQHALQYDWQTQILPKWLPFMDYLAEQVEARCFKLPEPSEVLKAKAKEMMTIG